MATEAGRAKPILFCSEMVRAIRLGWKTQTRRIHTTVKAGDMLWIKETWAVARCFDRLAPSRIPKGVRVRFKADRFTDEEVHGKWRPSMFMPRWVSRLRLRVKSVRRERLHAITEADAAAEGVRVPVSADGGTWYLKVGGPYVPKAPTCCEHFILLWETINGKNPETRWKRNPSVYRIEFEVMR